MERKRRGVESTHIVEARCGVMVDPSIINSGVKSKSWRRFDMQIKILSVFILVFVTVAIAGCSAPLSTREVSGLVGGGLGAGTGAIIGSTVGHAAAGAAIGGPIGLIAGALIGDQLMAAGQNQQRQVDSNQAELERLRRENRRLREQQER